MKASKTPRHISIQPASHASAHNGTSARAGYITIDGVELHSRAPTTPQDCDKINQVLKSIK